MNNTEQGCPRFAVCIENTDYLVSLELFKIYRILPDARAAEDEHVRVIDESGEDYLHPVEWFVAIEVPEAVEQALLRQS